MGKRSREKQERKLEVGEKQTTVSERRLGLEKIYFSIVEWGTYLILFTPLIFLRGYFFPYVVPKTIFFRILVDIILVAYILLSISNPKYKPRMNALTISIAFFILISIIASVFGVDFTRSFWSTFERMTGLITFLHLFAFYIVLTSVFKERKYWERILTVSILIGVLLVFYVSTSTDPTARGGGTLGNTSFMSAYLVFDIFFALILFLTKKGAWKIFYGFLAAPLIWLLLFPPQEPTMGAIGAFFGGIFLLGFGYLLFRLFTSGKKSLKKLAIGLIIFLILAGAGFTQTGFFKDKLAGVTQSSSWEARAVVWNMGFEGWKDRPWLGWGEENFNIPFAKHFDPGLPVTGDIWYDRVHNIVLDLLISSGVLGFLAYLAIFGTAIVGLLKICPKITEKQNAFFPLGMIALLAVYFVQNFWVFDMISSYMVFFLTLAFVCFLIQGGKSKTVFQEEEVKEKGMSPFLGALLIIATLFTLYFGNIQSAKSSNYVVRGISLPLEGALSAFQKAIEASPMAVVEAPEQISKKVTNLASEDNVDRDLLIGGFALAEKELKKSIERNPLDFRTHLILGKQYNDLYYLTGDQEALEKANETLSRAKELSPNNQQVYWSLAQTFLAQGLEDETVEAMQKSVDLDPNFPQSHWYLAMAQKAVQDYESAWESVKEAENVGFNWRGELEYLKPVIEINQYLKDDKELVELYSLAIEIDPKNAQFKAGLAVAYANLGQYAKARQSALEALDLNPDFADDLIDFINGLPQ